MRHVEIIGDCLVFLLSTVLGIIVRSQLFGSLQMRKPVVSDFVQNYHYASGEYLNCVECVHSPVVWFWCSTECLEGGFDGKVLMMNLKQNLLKGGKMYCNKHDHTYLVPVWKIYFAALTLLLLIFFFLNFCRLGGFLKWSKIVTNKISGKRPNIILSLFYEYFALVNHQQ